MMWEAFMTCHQHANSSPDKTWPSLRQIRCLVDRESNLEEHARRQIQNNFAAMTIVAGRYVHRERGRHMTLDTKPNHG